MIQWTTAENDGLDVLLFVYSRSTREYEITTLYSNNSYKNEILEIRKTMESLPFRILENPDDLFFGLNNELLSWKKCVTEFRSGEFFQIVTALQRENRINS